jgi:hypothetical protein
MFDFGKLQTKATLGGGGGSSAGDMPGWASGGDLEADRQRWLRGDGGDGTGGAGSSQAAPAKRPTRAPNEEVSKIIARTPTIPHYSPHHSQHHSPHHSPLRNSRILPLQAKRAEAWGAATPESKWRDAAPKLSSAISAGSLFSPGLSMFGQARTPHSCNPPLTPLIPLTPHAPLNLPSPTSS